ncbi:NAD(P)-binding protein [Trichoderma citrinoviride]|uniref:NAD(P)-binding protein n=1 Tax=Trichoderma citrinoviride TaxID=58853 RepID=A0A2T4BHX3_9HYPO|nr:NAD(P)-binding protein [Trichoderma citrinoviride]PTB68926.1 NAD(P)-binding protein [Trichoderma citrinoviride]
MADHQAKYAIYPSLVDRTIVITGGAQGIAAEMVEQFALQGSQVIFLDVEDDLAASLVQKISSNRGVKHEPIYFHCDVAKVDQELKPTAAEILRQHPKIDGLVNSAARAMAKPTRDITTEWWDDSVAVNLRHQFFLTQALLPGLLLASGHASVINMGSINWVVSATGQVPYTTSKAGVVGLTRTLAHEFGPQGIRVNSIMPGSIATERERSVVLTPEYEAKVLGHQAIKRLIEPVEVARMAMWLIADDSAAVTNQSMTIDGGWT